MVVEAAAATIVKSNGLLATIVGDSDGGSNYSG